MPKHVSPAITSKSFSCPHCGAHSDQTWFEAYADPVGNEERTPLMMTAQKLEEVKKNIGQHFDPEPARELLKRFAREVTGEPFLHRLENSVYIRHHLENIHLSSCYTCGEISIWRHDTILYPPLRYDIEPNPDLDEDIRGDFDEARRVLDLSPRSAAALLRLCIQKICKQLGLPGTNLNADIATLVAKGLDARVQKVSISCASSETTPCTPAS